MSHHASATTILVITKKEFYTKLHSKHTELHTRTFGNANSKYFSSCLLNNTFEIVDREPFSPCLSSHSKQLSFFFIAFDTYIPQLSKIYLHRYIPHSSNTNAGKHFIETSNSL
mmetsp:Transcript_1750/g.2704  ORF Transcript_1750/g.2704 Transcript_1750/m.2704 type:complete len:113 (-) Transcript_1750:502-840(-)